MSDYENDRREFLKKLSKWSGVVAVITLIAPAAGCFFYDDGYDDYDDWGYDDWYGDSYSDYDDWYGDYSDYDDWYGDYGDYGDYSDYSDW